MSERETKLAGDLQQWRGVNQRLQPTLVPHGYFSFVKGIYFGIGDNAERLSGKVASGNLLAPILQIFQFGELTLIQTSVSLLSVTTKELVNFDITGTVIPSDARTTEDGDIRITEDGDIRTV